MPWQETLHHKRETPQGHYHCDADDTNLGVICVNCQSGHPSAQTGLPGLKQPHRASQLRSHGVPRPD